MSVNVAFSAAGRRVELIEQFRSRLPSFGGGSITALEMCNDFAARTFVDSFMSVPPCAEDGFIDTVLRACQQNDISLLIPLIDTELSVYAANRDQFRDQGITVNVSGPETISICADKRLFAKSLKGIAQVPTEANELVDDQIAVIAKPTSGSSSIGLQMFERLADVPPETLQDPAFLVQQRVFGEEYAVDIFVDGSARALYVRHQYSMRAGETDKARSVINDDVCRTVSAAVNTLPDAFGVIHADVIVDRETGEPVILEMNPRFPGGYPLSHEAGSPMIDWLLTLAIGDEPDYSRTPFRPLTMSRYSLGAYG